MSNIDTINTIGIVGLGLMGRAFAQRLQGAGHTVLGYDVSPQKSAEFGASQTCASVQDLARRCDVLLLAVFDTQQVEDVIFGPQGIAQSDPGQTLPHIVCTSTCDPDHLEAIAQCCQAVGISFLELPFSGTSLQVARGDGVGLMGGEPALCEALSGLLDLLCPQRHHIGKCGDANRAKLAVNLVLGLHRASLAEGLNFGQRIGLDPAKLLHILQNSAAASSVMKVKGPLMVKRQYDQPQSRVDQSLKDFALIQAQGEKAGQQLPLADVYVKLLQSCSARGESHLDNAVIFEAIARCTT
jgi:L-threonate 2-dehydrogenase